MKTLVLTISLLGSFSAFAMSEFELSLSEDVTFLQGSKNYEGKYLNDDGSMSIYKPKFSNADGNGSKYISVNSSYNGLCKLYGLGTFIPGSAKSFKQDSTDSVVKINSSGRFQEFVLSRTINAVRTFACAPITGMPRPSLVSGNHSGIFLNDDGSKTVLYPRFKMDAYIMGVSLYSNMQGLCKLYGLGSYVENSIVHMNKEVPGYVVKVNSGAQFQEFDYARDTYYIQSFMCY